VHVEFEVPIKGSYILVSATPRAQSGPALRVKVCGYRITRDPTANATITIARIMFHLLVAGDKSFHHTPLIIKDEVKHEAQFALVKLSAIRYSIAVRPTSDVALRFECSEVRV